MYALLRALLFLLPPEAAHGLAVVALRLVASWPWLCRRLRGALLVPDERLSVRALGLEFPSPLGVAAGFDKGGGLAGGLFALGFGSVEAGTITPLPQPGNPRPRLFRLAGQRALVNRMGFNNEGAEVAARRYGAVRFRPAPLGINLGRNKDTPPERAGADYLSVLQALWDAGDFFVVNVSSPNTPGLRDLQAPETLRALVRPLVAEARRRGGKPLLVKLAPDLADEDVDRLSDLAVEEGLAGLVLANTSVGRDGVAGEPGAREAGGLSGPPLLARAIHLVARVRRRHGDKLTLIGVGGIQNGQDAYRMIRAGATLVQAYTGFVWGGPGFARGVGRELALCLARDGLPDVAAAVGLDAGLDQRSSNITIASSPSSA